jgi:SAM-dependent methyltransferase
VQRIERRYQARKDPANLLAIKRLYWRRLLDVLPAGTADVGPQTRVLDAGCGGASILLALERGARTGVDPLMTFYLEKFPFLRESPIRWIEGVVEEFDPGELFDLVFSINMLDHTREPRRVADNLARLLAPGGRLVCAVNVHLTRFWRAYYARFHRFVDPPHPHHIHRDDVEGYFPALPLMHRQDIDSLWLDLRKRHDVEVCRRSRRGPKEMLASLSNPFKYPIAASEILLGRRFHRRRAEDVPIMATTLYVFAATGGDR